MLLGPDDIERYGDELYDAFLERRTVPPLRDRVDGLTIEGAYGIASRFVARRVNAGETVVGKKIGLTSEAVQTQLGVYEPDFGQLLSGMAHDDGAVIDLGTLIQPKAEGEVAFVLKSDLNGPGVTAADVLAATDYVQACFEIVDSRIEGWNIRIGDTVADNASCGVYVLGEMQVDADDLDLAAVEMVVERNGEVATSGTGAAVQGSPVNSVVWLANTLGHIGIQFRAGEVILSGSLGSFVAIEAGDRLTCRISGLGECTVSFK